MQSAGYSEMKDREIYSRLTTTLPYIIRLDGRSFHTYTAGFAKPYDENLSGFFIQTAKTLFTASGLSPDFIYTFSDEISMYIRNPVFDCRVEKLVSVSASFASSAFMLASGAKIPLAFDARIVPVPESGLADYLAWRQEEAWRNHINAYCQSILTGSGTSPSDAQKELNGMNAQQLHDFAFEHGINLAKTPAWQRRGIAVYRGTVEKTGYNPVTDRTVPVLRSIAVADTNLPLFSTEEGKIWLASRLNPVSPTAI